MLNFNEKLLQFIWQNRLLKPQPLFTKSGKEIIVLKPGDANTNAGPDFFNGQVRLENLVLAGNIEVHLKTSDWLKHGHQQNKNYDNLILHVVYEHDMDLPQNVTNHVEVLELKNLISEKTLEAYVQLTDNPHKLPCASQLKDVSSLKFISWMERMTIERLEVKVKRIEQLFDTFKGDYTQTFYTLLLRNFGFNVNALPFELMAKHLPVQILLKHADNQVQLEALLLGVAGMLDDQLEDKGMQNLQNEFAHLKNKYQFVSLQQEIFKYSRLRPANFPSLRLAQFAALVYANPNFLTIPQSFDTAEKLKQALKIKMAGYWKNHYTTNGKIVEKELSFGAASAENIIINTLAPFFFFYGKKLLKPKYQDLAIALLTQAAFESNSKTKLFEQQKELLKTAADSQAIINLHDNYCSKKQCLKCGIAASVLSAG